MKKYYLLLSFCLTVLNSNGQWFNPSLSLPISYSMYNTDAQINAGKFDTEIRKLNIGFEFINKLSINKKYSINVGLRRIPLNFNVISVNQIATLLDYPPPSQLTNKFAVHSLPITLNKSITLSSNIIIDLFAGVSIGMVINNYEKIKYSTGIFNNISTFNSITISSEPKDEPALIKSQFLSTIELGLKYTPFKYFKKVKIGINLSYGLNDINVGNLNFWIKDGIKNETFYYNASFSQKIFFLGASIYYQFKLKNN